MVAFGRWEQVGTGIAVAGWRREGRRPGCSLCNVLLRVHTLCLVPAGCCHGAAGRVTVHVGATECYPFAL